MGHGSTQLHLTLTVSPIGDVTDTDAGGDPEALKFWPQLEGEVYRWKFTPFEKNGKAVTAEVEEYIDLVPPERLPKVHIVAPTLRADSKVTISLERSGCYGTCPSYSVEVSTDGILFDGGGYVVARGEHRDTVDADAVRKFAKSFVAADFYSMDSRYTASVTDCPTFVLSMVIDGHPKKVIDYMGSRVGMPAAITALEEEVDSLARTQRWIEGSEGLVMVLKAEKFNFKTFDAQVMLKESAANGQAATIREFLEAGVPLKPLPAPKPKDETIGQRSRAQ
jgi:hypothetical protein